MTTRIQPVIPGDTIFLSGFNDRGEMTGFERGAVWLTSPAFGWVYKDAVFHRITGLPGTDQEALAMNNNGDVVGFWQSVDPIRLAITDGGAFVYNDGQVTLIPKPPGFLYCEGLDINIKDDVIGFCKFTPYDEFVYQDEVATTLPTRPGYAVTHASQINDQGLVIGAFVGSSSTTPNQGLVYWKGVTTNLTLPGGSASSGRAQQRRRCGWLLRLARRCHSPIRVR